MTNDEDPIKSHILTTSRMTNLAACAIMLGIIVICLALTPAPL